LSNMSSRVASAGSRCATTMEAEKTIDEHQREKNSRTLDGLSRKGKLPEDASGIVFFQLFWCPGWKEDISLYDIDFRDILRGSLVTDAVRYKRRPWHGTRRTVVAYVIGFSRRASSDVPRRAVIDSAGHKRSRSIAQNCDQLGLQKVTENRGHSSNGMRCAFPICLLQPYKSQPARKCFP
jgi:hypothetical protein